MRRTLLHRAAAMRREPTMPEHLLWLELRGRRLGGFKFRRQATIGTRIVDFFCPAKGLIVEIDGGTHQSEADARADRVLQQATGFVTVRFTNDEIMGNMDGVKTALLATLDGRAERWAGARGTTPNPLL